MINKPKLLCRLPLCLLLLVSARGALSQERPQERKSSDDTSGSEASPLSKAGKEELVAALQRPDQRLRAAEVLHARGLGAWQAAILAEWKEVPARERARRQAPSSKTRRVLYLLLKAPEGVNALVEAATDLGPGICGAIAGGCADWGARRPQEGPLLKALERLFEGLLRNLNEVALPFALSASGGSEQAEEATGEPDEGDLFREARPGMVVGDLAVAALHRLRPERFPCDLSATREERARLRVQAENLLRKARGAAQLEQVPEIKPRTPPARLVRSLEEALGAAKTPQERGRVHSRMQALGLKGLALLKGVKDPRPETKALIAELAYLVDTVRTATPKGLELSQAFLARLEAERGQRLSLDRFSSLFKALAREAPPGASLSLQAYRGGPRAGVTLRVVVDRSNPKPSAEFWAPGGIGCAVSLELFVQVQASPMGPDPHPVEAGLWKSFRATFDLAPGEPFEARLCSGRASNLSFSD